MRTIIKTMFLLILLLVFTRPIYAEKIAGNSAVITYNIGALEEKQSFFIKKLAIKRVLNKYNAPLSDATEGFVNTCKKYNLDCFLLPSIAGLESTFGHFIYPHSHNPFGWGRGYIMFESWEEGIDAVGKGLREGYLNHGALSVNEIGPIYSESPTWAVRVKYFINEFEKEEAKLQLYLNENTVEL
ncbi:glucosaminidase domain-containing protein [Candidatus Roizmanbacteria bacterium]|nr:glucosaminidase domain-containing protein [Candidatus Roizmanbacteria bacterium]